MWHLSEEYISGRFRGINERFDALERSVLQQTRELKNDSDTRIEEVEERINKRLDTIVELLEVRQEPELLEDKSATSASPPKSPADKDVLNAPTVRPSHQQPDVGNREVSRAEQNKALERSRGAPVKVA